MKSKDLAVFDLTQEKDEVRDRYGRGKFGQGCLLAGGGIKGGIKYGRTDKEGREIVENKVTVTDFNATIATCMGLSLTKKVVSPSGRPFTVADDGNVVADLFS